MCFLVWIHTILKWESKYEFLIEHTIPTSLPHSKTHTYFQQLPSNSMSSSYCFCLALHKYNRQERRYNSTASPVSRPLRNELLLPQNISQSREIHANSGRSSILNNNNNNNENLSTFRSLTQIISACLFVCSVHTTLNRIITVAAGCGWLTPGL